MTLATATELWLVEFNRPDLTNMAWALLTKHQWEEKPFATLARAGKLPVGKLNVHEFAKIQDVMGVCEGWTVG